MADLVMLRNKHLLLRQDELEYKIYVARFRRSEIAMYLGLHMDREYFPHRVNSEGDMLSDSLLAT